MKRIDAGLKSRSPKAATLLCSLLGGILLTSTGCGKGGDEAAVLLGERNRVRGEACVSYMDCVEGLECVDGICGVFGESTQPPPDPATCPLPKGDGESAENPTSAPVQTSSSTQGVPSSTTSTTGATSTTSTTSTTSSGETTPEPEPEPEPKPEPKPEVHPKCKNLDPKFHPLKNPYQPTNAAAVAEGKKLYRTPGAGKSCAGSSCHGSSGGGNGRDSASDFTTQDSKNQPDCFMYYITAKGIADVMPDYETALTEDEIWKVLTYIRSLSL